VQKRALNEHAYFTVIVFYLYPPVSANQTTSCCWLCCIAAWVSSQMALLQCSPTSAHALRDSV